MAKIKEKTYRCEYSFKIAAIGNSNVGKGEILRKLHHDSSTIGGAFVWRTVYINGNKIKLELWDTTGTERYDSLAPMYYRGTHGYMLIFNIGSQTSFERATYWKRKIKEIASPDVQVLLVGHICDHESYRQVSYEEGKQFAEENGIQYIEVCAETNHNVVEALELLARQIFIVKELQVIEKLLNKQSSSASHPSHVNTAAVATVKAFQLAMHEGMAQSDFFRICVFGPENSGKTCLIATLFDEAFQHNEATEGADVHIGTIFVSDWNKISTEQIADKLESKFYHGLNTEAIEHTKTSSIQEPSVQASSIQVASATNKHGFVSKLKAIFVKSQPTTSPANSQSHTVPEVDETPTIKFEDIKRARTSEVINNDEFTAVVWDFAGQIQYLSTHTVFIRKNNVVLIVFKASCDLSGFVTARENDQESSPCHKTTHFGVIHYWLQSISSVCHDAGGADHMSEFLPTAILVATHIDEILGNIEEAKEAIIAQLARELEGKPYAKHLAGNLPGVGLVDALKRYCIFLSNKIRDANMVTKLKEIVLQASAPTMKEKHPLVYLKIEKKLLLLEKEMITTTEFHKIAVENGFIADRGSKEMTGVLDYFHQRGVILYFPTIESLVFLSPQWLEKLVAYLVVAHQYKPRGDEYDYSYRHLTRKGVLLGSFLQHMLQMFNQQQRSVGCEISFDQAVAFLVKFGFIAKSGIITKFLEESHPWSGDEKVFIVPSLLPEDNRERKAVFVKEKNVWSIHFVFINGFIPLMVFHHMISFCIEWNVSENQSIAWLKRYEIMMVLNHDKFYSVSLCKEKSSIQLDIILEKDAQSSTDSRKQLIEFFQIMLDQTCDVFMPASPKPVAYIPCPYCSELHIRYKNLLENRPQLCEIKSIPSDYYQDLIMDTQGISMSTGQFEEKDKISVPNLLQRLRPVTNWRDLGEHLLPFEEVQIIYANHKNDDIQTCKRELFTMYMQMGDRSWNTVITALIKCGHKNLAKDIKEELGL